MQSQNDDVQIALLVQKVEYLADAVADLKEEIDDLKSKSLRISGGLAVIVVGGAVLTWVANLLTKVKFTIQ